MMADAARLNSMSIRFQKFKTLLDSPNVDIEQLKKLAWAGVPDEIRPTVWKLLMAYLPTNSDRRASTLERKRKEYDEYALQAFQRAASLDTQLSHQIHIDIQRTNAGMALYQQEATQKALERILYIWAIRHPASGYVQGINDLLTPFFQVFLAEHCTSTVDKCDMGALSTQALAELEADCYWCLCKLLDGIQDNYTHGQPGIHRQVLRMKELISRVDGTI